MKSLARPSDTSEILERLRAVRPDSPRSWGRMSAHQMVCHLSDSLRMARGDKPVRPRGGWMDRTLVRWVALYAPFPWPGGRIVTLPEVDQEQGGTPPADFAADLAELERMTREFVDAGPALEGRPHPVLGRLSAAAWLRWGYLHADHHLRQFGR